MIDAGNARYEAVDNARLAKEIRSFRPVPVQNLSDKQLAWVVARSRASAKQFGIKEPLIIKLWIMAEALIAPGFCTMPQVRDHFATASGDPDTKASDVLQLLKLTFVQNGRGDEVWW